MSMFTKRHYEALAASLALSRPWPYGREDEYNHQWWRDVQYIADVLSNDNPRFDLKRFLSAVRR